MSFLRFLLILPVAILASCTMHLPAPEAARYRVEATRPATVETVPVYLLADKLHTALVFDLKWLEQSGYRKPTELGNPKYVTMSWGDEVAYVQERWLSPGQVFRALFKVHFSPRRCRELRPLQLIVIHFHIRHALSHQMCYHR
jgi:hypothetical protein